MSATCSGSEPLASAMPAIAAEVDALSFDRFFAEHRDEIAAAVAVTIGTPVLAAEATDEAMARALSRWRSVSEMSNPSGWVYAVALNWSRGVFRRRRHEALGADPEIDGAPDITTDVDLQEALRSLPHKHRSVVVLRHLLGFSVEETAEVLGVPAGTVKSRLSRALDALRSHLEER